MNRIVLIIPYFGKFNNYFHLWMESANQNQNIDFLIVTDNEKPKNCGKNIIFLYDTFENLKNRIMENIGLKNAKLRTSYKLCEYRLLYGKLFEKEIEKYDFWGFCDVDLIFGRITDFLSDELLDRYDKFYSRGHLTIFRNNEFFKNLYAINDYRMRVNYKIAWRTNHSVHFDELPCWNKIIEENGYKCYDKVDFCDIEISRFRFTLAMGDNFPVAKQIFAYKDGNLFRYYMDSNDHVVNEKVLYVHLQKRNMECNITNNNSFLIIPNAFVETHPVDIALLNKCSKEKKVWFAYYIRRVKEIVNNIKNGALKVRWIVYRRKRSIKEKLRG